MYDQLNYQAAGAITTYLLDVGGSAKFQKLWSSVSAGSSARDLSKALQSIYGLSLDDVWQSLLTIRHRPCAPVWMCSLPAITASEQGTLRSTCTGKDLGRPTSGNLRLQFPLWSNGAIEIAWCSTTNCIGGPTPSAALPQLPVTAVSMIACDGDPTHQLPRDPQVQLFWTTLSDNLKADTWIPPLSTPHVVMVEQFAWVISNLQSVYNTPAGSLPYATQSLAPTNTRCSEAQANAIDDETASITLDAERRANALRAVSIEQPRDVGPVLWIVRKCLWRSRATTARGFRADRGTLFGVQRRRCHPMRWLPRFERRLHREVPEFK
jgi:hypothetical protein